MLDYGVTGDFEERFWDVKGKWAESRASRGTSDLDRSSAIGTVKIWKIELTSMTAFVVFCPPVGRGRTGTSRDAIATADQRPGSAIVG